MSKTPKSTAEKLARQTAMQCTGSIIDDTQAILSTIPIVEYEECVEALKECRRAQQNITSYEEDSAIIKQMEKALANLDTKLKEKGQP